MRPYLTSMSKHDAAHLQRFWCVLFKVDMYFFHSSENSTRIDCTAELSTTTRQTADYSRQSYRTLSSRQTGIASVRYDVPLDS
jgi:hypothetical protein